MGKYDEQIASNERYLELAEQELDDLARGLSFSINDVDMAPEIKKRAEVNRDLSLRLIAAYRKANAKRP